MISQFILTMISLAALAAAQVPALEDQDAGEAVAALLAAKDAESRAEVVRRAASELEAPDAFLVARGLLLRHVEGTEGALAACERFAAEAARAATSARPLAALVERWREWGEEDLAREGRLDALLDGAGADGFLTRVSDGAEDLAVATRSLSAGLVLLRAGIAAERAQDLEAAAGFFDDAANRAGDLGWAQLEVRALNLAASLQFGRDFQRGLQHLDRALEVCARAGLSRPVPDLAHNQGNMLRQSGQAARAAERFRAAASLFDEQQRPVDAIRSRIGLGSTLVRLGRHDEAEALYRELLPSVEERGLRAERASLQMELSNLRMVGGDLEGALAHTRAAAAVLDDLGRPPNFALARYQEGVLLDQLGRLDEALAPLAEARELAGEHGGLDLAASATASLGVVHLRLGEIAVAEPMLREAMSRKELVGNRLGYELARMNLANLLRIRGDHAEALQLLESSGRALEEMGSLLYAVMAETNTALVYADLALPDEAWPHLARSIELAEQLGYPQGVATALDAVASLAMAAGDGERALSAARRAQEVSREAGDAIGEARALLQQGSAHELLGDLEAALALLERAEARFEELGVAHYVAAARRSRIRPLASLGRHEDALAAAASARAIQSEIGDASAMLNVELDEAHVRLQVGDHGGAALAARRAALLQLRMARGMPDSLSHGTLSWARRAADIGVAAVHGGGGSFEDALWFVETGSCLSLATLITNREALLDAELEPELTRAAGVARLRVGQAREALELAIDEGEEPARLAAARDALERAQRGHEHVLARIQRAARHVAGLVYAQAVEPATLRDCLAPDEALLLFRLSEWGAFVLVVHRDGGTLVGLGDTAALRDSARRYARLVATDGTEEEGLAEELFARLLAPLRPHLEGRSRLLISPDGPLAFVPFEALVERTGVGTRRAIERWEVTYVPSGTVLAVARASTLPRGEGVVALGDPVYGHPSRAPQLRGARLERLPGTAAEVRGVAELFPEGQSVVLLREDASRAALEAALRARGERRAAIHLACHGILDPEHPRRTGLALADGEVLTLADLYRMRIPADLAVLSACHSGQGELSRAEGVFGLVRGLLFAGCPRVVVSNWSVLDDGARSLVLGFYEGLLREGRSPSEALRAAKLARLRGGGRTAHPFHWAGFVLWGLPE